jgi:hypothetical protein
LSRWKRLYLSRGGSLLSWNLSGVTMIIIALTKIHLFIKAPNCLAGATSALLSWDNFQPWANCEEILILN